MVTVTLFGIILNSLFIILATYSVLMKNAGDTKLYLMLAMISVVITILSAQLFHVK